jgi:hypothetical protein
MASSGTGIATLFRAPLVRRLGVKPEYGQRVRHRAPSPDNAVPDPSCYDHGCLYCYQCYSENDQVLCRHGLPVPFPFLLPVGCCLYLVNPPEHVRGGGRDAAQYGVAYLVYHCECHAASETGAA